MSREERQIHSVVFMRLSVERSHSWQHSSEHTAFQPGKTQRNILRAAAANQSNFPSPLLHGARWEADAKDVLRVDRTTI